MALHLIQQPDGLFCTFDPAAASFPATDLTRAGVVAAVREAMGPGCSPEGVAARVAYLVDGAASDLLRWGAVRRRVCQVHGPDAAAWMLTVERKAAVHAFNHATPEQIEAAISTLSPEGQAWARDFEARGKR